MFEGRFGIPDAGQSRGIDVGEDNRMAGLGEAVSLLMSGPVVSWVLNTGLLLAQQPSISDSGIHGGAGREPSASGNPSPSWFQETLVRRQLLLALVRSSPSSATNQSLS